MEKKSILNISFFNFALVIFLAVETNFDWSQSQVLHWGALGLLMVAYIFKDGGALDFKLHDYSWWLLGVLCLTVLSLFYGINTSGITNLTKNFIVLLVALTMIRNHVSDSKKADSVLTAYFIATFINMVYVITSIDASVIGNVQLGTEAIEGWNGNSIGLAASVGAILGLYNIIKIKDWISKIVILLISCFFVYMFVYTGSRKSIIMFVVCLLIILYATKPKAIIKNTVITALILCVVYNVCMNVESVYNVLGTRLEGLVAGFTGEGEVDASTESRQEYIENGWKWIKEAPVIGYGADGYKLMNGAATGRVVYSHNNFIEIAINWGIIGFIYYYAAYLIVIKRLIKKLKNNLMNITIFSLLVVNLILHYGMVTYYDLYSNLILCIAWALISNSSTENKEETLDDKKIT